MTHDPSRSPVPPSGESVPKMPESGSLPGAESPHTGPTSRSGADSVFSPGGKCTGKTGKRFTSPAGIGLIGNPIGHSLSPALFREYFASRPDILKQWSYDLIERDSFDEAWDAFLQDYAAVNVTAPFKENAFRAADSHDYSALRCRASNLLVKTPDEGVKAYNTDFEAVLEIIQQELQLTAATEKAERRKVMVIGAGGAGKAATAAAIEAGMQVSLCNRTVSRAQEFADYLLGYDPHGRGSVTRVIGTDLYSAILEAGIIIYTLPGPSDILTHLLSSAPDIFSGKIVLEANYKDPVLASVPCRRYISGLTWLRLQAIATYRIVITGRRPSRPDAVPDGGRRSG